MHIVAVLSDDVVHCRRVPSGCLRLLLFAEIDAEFVLVRCRTTLFVGRPCVSLVAAADDTIVAGDVELLRILGDDWKLIDLPFESHFSLPHRTLDSRPYKSSSTPSA